MVKNKIRLAVVISIISVIIAVISLSLSVYMNIKELQYKEYSKNMQEINQELEKRGLSFDENYKKISLAEKSVMDVMDNCNKEDINEKALNDNLRSLIEARNSLIKNDAMTTEIALKKIDATMICNRFIKDNNSYFKEIGLLVIIWITLIFCFFLIKYKNKK